LTEEVDKSYRDRLFGLAICVINPNAVSFWGTIAMELNHGQLIEQRLLPLDGP